MEVNEQGREAARETGRRATRPAQGSAMGVADAQLLLEFDALCVWTPVDRVIVRRKTTHLARERRGVFVEVAELQTYIYIYIYIYLNLNTHVYMKSDRYCGYYLHLVPECVRSRGTQKMCDKEKKKDDAGGKCDAACGDASCAGKRSAESSRKPPNTKTKSTKGLCP